MYKLGSKDSVYKLATSIANIKLDNCFRLGQLQGDGGNEGHNSDHNGDYYCDLDRHKDQYEH